MPTNSDPTRTSRIRGWIGAAGVALLLNLAGCGAKGPEAPPPDLSQYKQPEGVGNVDAKPVKTSKGMLIEPADTDG